MLLETIRHDLVKLNQELPKNHLVTWTSGNVSIRDPETGYVAIKPSGVMFEDLTAEDMVVLDLDGKVIEGKRKPSSDTASHLLHLPRPRRTYLAWFTPTPITPPPSPPSASPSRFT